MDIKSFGEQQVRKFYEMGLLKDIPGIYALPFETIGMLDGFGAKSISNLKLAIEQSKTQPLHRLIFGLGIRFVGETTAKTLARAIQHITELEKATEEWLITLEDIGPKVAGSIVQFFSSEANRQLLRQLEEAGVNVSQEPLVANADAGELAGKSFLFTGTLSRLKRSEAEAQVESAGGTILSGVSSKLHYLVVGEDAGSKLEKAKKINTIKILSEDEFLQLMPKADMSK